MPRKVLDRSTPGLDCGDRVGRGAPHLVRRCAPLLAKRKKLDDWPALGRYAEADAALPPTQPGRVVFYGDSITDAWTRNGGRFFPGKPYINRGISGQTTEQMVVRFRQDVDQSAPHGRRDPRRHQRHRRQHRP